VIASLIGASLGYLVMFAIASQPVPPIAGDDRRANVFGWIITLVPRVGIIRQF
jgi:hypothetical protein